MARTRASLSISLQELLRRYHLFPRVSRHWGQHFLIDEGVLDDIIASAKIHPGDTILEIGPATGTLTERLLAQGATVVAIEQDRAFQRLLHERFHRCGRFRLVVGNALVVDWRRLGLTDQSFLIVANLPYSITTPLIERLLLSPQPCQAILMIQKEVGERLNARPGNSHRGALSVIAQEQFAMETIRVVPPYCFFPPPEVTSIVIRLKPLACDRDSAFYQFVRNGFSHRRKVLLKHFSVAYPGVDWKKKWSDLGITPSARPQEITNEQWRRLYCF